MKIYREVKGIPEPEELEKQKKEQEEEENAYEKFSKILKKEKVEE